MTKIESFVNNVQFGLADAGQFKVKIRKSDTSISSYDKKLHKRFREARKNRRNYGWED